MLLFIDNFDSFTFNLVQYFERAGAEVRVRRHCGLTPTEALIGSYQGIVFGPGPGSPKDAGISRSLIRAAAGRLPLFGVCLGMQCMVEEFGGKVVRSPRVMHGKTSRIFHSNQGVFRGLPQGFSATRYHSLIADPHSIPDELEIAAWTEEGEVMGVRHREFEVEGVQFHPESILTIEGMNAIKNFIIQVKGDRSCKSY